MTNNNFFHKDSDVGIVRDGEGKPLEIRPVDYWWNAPASENMKIYRIGEKLVCASGWNGECYLESFEVSDRFTATPGGECILTPVYRFETESRQPDDDSDDDFEIVGFYIG